MANPQPRTVSDAVGSTRHQNLAEMFFFTAEALKDELAIKHRPHVGDAFADLSFGALRLRVDAVAAGLLSLPAPVAAGGVVGIMGATCLDWIVADFAALSIGAVVVPIYPSLVAGETGFIAADAAVEVVFVQDAAALQKLRTVWRGFDFLQQHYEASALKLRLAVVFDAEGIAPSSDWMSLFELEALGKRNLLLSEDERATRRRNLHRSALCSIAYTSGTTGAPKGVLQTHDNWLSVLEVAADLEMFTLSSRKTGALLFLPLAHSFGRLIEFGLVFFGGMSILSSVTTLLEDLLASRPGVVPSAPRMYEKMYARIMSAVKDSPPRRRAIFTWALGVGTATIPFRQKRLPLPTWLRVQHAIADRVVLSALRVRLGLDRTQSMVTGSAPLAPAVHAFFLAIGVLLIEGYGLTESCPVLTANRPDRWKLGTVGLPLRGVQIRIADDGEVCAKGPNITQGYHRRDAANAEAFDVDGWFHTGDIGELDAEGFLSITDRKKDLLKTSGGKYVAPVKIEGLLKAVPLVAEAIVLGDNRKYCVALLVVDDDDLAAWAKRNEKPADRQHPTLLAELKAGVDEVNRSLASFESVKYFRVINGALSVDDGTLTASFKVKRKAVLLRYGELVESMYGEQVSASFDAHGREPS